MLFRPLYFGLAASLLILPSTANAGMITGTVSDWVESTNSIVLGDGTNEVVFGWSIRGANTGYGYGASSSTLVAAAAGVTDISQVTPTLISSLNFNTAISGFVSDKEADPDGVGDFVVAYNTVTGHYGAVRFDDIVGTGSQQATLNATWWFQSDGTATFGVPTPSTALLAGLAFAFAFRSKAKSGDALSKR